MKQQFFKMPNSLILDQSLTYSAKKICSKLYSLKNYRYKVTINNICKKSKASQPTVYKVLKQLESQGYLHRVKNCIWNENLSRVVWDRNSYVCNVSTQSNFTMIPMDIFNYNLTFGAFTLYCYLKMVCGQKSHTFPSYSKIYKDIGMSKSAVQQAIHQLKDENLIHSENCVKQNGTFANNSYFFVKRTIKITAMPLNTTELILDITIDETTDTCKIHETFLSPSIDILYPKLQ